MQFMATEQALLHIWVGEPWRALELLESALSAPDHIEVNGEMGQLLVLAARAAADLAAAGSAAAELQGRLRNLHAAANVDPFTSGAMPVDLHAAPQWAAELARLNGTESIQQWGRAADAWDKLSWPHEAAYCRWRGAQVALRENHATVAGRLLKRAATDAHQHVPLTRVIAATARGS